MDINLYVARGCYYAATIGGVPYWSLSAGLPDKSIAPNWISSVQGSVLDNIATLPCFNNTKVASIIGQQFGSIAIGVTALLGQESKNKFEGAFQSSMQAARASSSGGTVNLSSIGGGGYRLLLSGFGPSHFDAERNILTMQVQGIVV